MTDPAASRRPRLSDTRVKIALFVAGFEGLLLLFGRLSRWVLIAVSIPVVLLYFMRGRELRPGLARNALWVVAAAQLLVIVVAIVAFFVSLLFVVLLGIFVGIAFLLIYLDQPGRSRRG